VRALNTELRNGVAGSHRALSIERQVQMLSRRSGVLHAGVVLSVVTLVAFLGSSAVVFVTSVGYSTPGAFATMLFMLGLTSFGASLMTTLGEMLWARRSLDEDIAGSRPPSA
jgi:NCAIR mutase (PurE)-related protein